MKENTINEVREKVFNHNTLSENRIWGKTYLKSIVADSEVRVFTYDEEKIVVEIDTDGHLWIEDDKQWIYIYNIKAMEIIKEAIEIAIRKQNEIWRKISI